MGKYKRTAILSTNDSSDYISCLPYTQKAWNKIGWNTVTFYLGNQNLESTDLNTIVEIEPLSGYRDSTVVQVSRLFGALHTSGLIMTADVDMLPLSNYWNPREDCWTVYGEDLTNYKHFPICYVAGGDSLWKQAFPETSIKELLEKYPQSTAESFNEWWFVDQDIVTERVKPFNPIKINRGVGSNSLPTGRIDRSLWEVTKNMEGEKIDAHLLRPFNKLETEKIFNTFCIP
jgi:hypothetical protein